MPEDGWIWREGMYATNSEAMMVAKSIEDAPEKMAKMYADAKKRWDEHQVMQFGPLHTQSISY